MCCVFTFLQLEEFSMSFLFFSAQLSFRGALLGLYEGGREPFTFEDVLTSGFPWSWSRGCPLQDTHTALTRLGGHFFSIKSRGEQSEKKMERVGGEMTARCDHMSLSRYEILGKKKTFKILRWWGTPNEKLKTQKSVWTGRFSAHGFNSSAWKIKLLVLKS